MNPEFIEKYMQEHPPAQYIEPMSPKDQAYATENLPTIMKTEDPGKLHPLGFSSYTSYFYYKSLTKKHYFLIFSMGELISYTEYDDSFEKESDGGSEENFEGITLRKSSVASTTEYYLGDKPGTLQYRVPCALIQNLRIPNEPLDETHRYETVQPSLEILNRVIPDTPKGRNLMKHGVVLVMQHTEPDGTIWLKAAFQNPETGDIALMTSTNDATKLNRAIKTLDAGWFIGHYRMSAPLQFWRKLSVRLSK